MTAHHSEASGPDPRRSSLLGGQRAGWWPFRKRLRRVRCTCIEDVAIWGQGQDSEVYVDKKGCALHG